MSFPNGHVAWQSPGLHRANSLGKLSHLDDGFSYARTNTPPGTNPVAGGTTTTTTAAATTATDRRRMNSAAPDAATDSEDDSRRAHFAELYRQTESRISMLFADDGRYNYDSIRSLKRSPPPQPRPEHQNLTESLLPPTTDHTPIREPPLKKAKRAIDEDDYDDDDDDEDEDGDAQQKEEDKSQDKPDGDNTEASRAAALRAKNAAAASSLLSPSKSGSSPVHSVSKDSDAASQGHGPSKSTEDARKKLEQDKFATEDTARRSFWTMFHTFENDRTAMIEQQQLEESEKQLQAEMENGVQTSSAAAGGGPNGTPSTNPKTLASANLGASSLTLKHLIARIDLKRDQVLASDAELRLLMNEVRKNRSKWASEENVNQEELYEAFEKILTELKAHTEYSTPFLQRVNKRDAPDYYNIIKVPMDLGSMTKKLKSLAFKSKADFVADLNLIWDNCLRYNQDANHHLRRMANGMRKEAEKLIPLIPDLAIRSRAEVEAEERRKQNGGEDDAGDDSDDEPIMSSRGRTAGTKGSKSRKAPADEKEGTPSTEQKPSVPYLNGLITGKPHREGSEAGEGVNGLGTPVLGASGTPIPMPNGTTGNGSDAMDLDGPSLSNMALTQAIGEVAEQVYEDDEYKIWKQVTKKDRALVAKERTMLFNEDGTLNPDAPALLRKKAGIRRFLKNQKEAESRGIIGKSTAGEDFLAGAAGDGSGKTSETLAEGLDGNGEGEKTIPYYYEPLNLVPDIMPKLQWIEDSEGQVINQHEEYLNAVPSGHFLSPASRFTRKMDNNIRQIQETRKLATRISVVKQMQVQTQVYTNQFPKTNSEPFVEHDIEPHYISDMGPVIAPGACQEAFRRSVAKICYSTGFEELQPSAMDALTSLGQDYFQNLIRIFKIYAEAEMKDEMNANGEPSGQCKPRFTPEEVVLHTLDEEGHDVGSLEAYAKDDVDRLGTKLGVIHERMKQHLTDLLRPALTNDAGADGVGAFNDGSEQFVSGDFAEDLGEDFFGFRSLGLDRELGLDMISVPLHLLQSRVRNQYQLQTQTMMGSSATDQYGPLPPSEPLTKDNLPKEIGLVQEFFMAKMRASNDRPLVEDEDLPIKQRRPRPRLGNTGKIVSPQKRPPREQIAMAKKKKKLEAQAAAAAAAAAANGGTGAGPAGSKGGVSSAAQTKGKPNTTKSLGLTNGVVSNPALALPAPDAAAAPMAKRESAQSFGGDSQADERDEAAG